MPDSRDADPACTDARLSLGFSADAGCTRLTGRAHVGPLRVQKPLYPEGPGVCHAIVVHPPGGVVGGDRLAIDATVEAGAHAFLTTPGAAKWYKANGKVSRQEVRLRVDAGASLEWMPQEAIFFNHASVVLEHEVELAADAVYIGCEIVCLGRRACAETFDSGAIVQRTRIRRGGKWIWWEQGRLDGGGAALASPLGLNGMSVCATLIAVGAPLSQDRLAQVRAAMPGAAGGQFGMTQMKQLLVARYLGHDSEAARRVMLDVWSQLRPHLLARAAQVPRIWRT